MSSTLITNTVNTVGTTLASSVSNGINWTGITSSSNNPVLTLNNDPATLKVDGNVVINGRDLEERIKVIEDVLAIPERDVELESKYPKLKKMYDEYIKELSKARMWETLKGKK